MNSTQQKLFKQLLSVPKRQFSLYSYSDRSNPRVFLTISKNGQTLGDLVFELYRNHAPQNVESFVSFATGNNAWGGNYKGLALDRGLPGSVLGTGHVWPCESSASGHRQVDEDLSLRHFKRGQLTL
jgi:cyclophilin family peptidyl-prolyl cis-trans isomerase